MPATPVIDLDGRTVSREDRRRRSGPVVPRPGSGGPENGFTNRNTTFMTHNLMHLAAMLRAAGACRRAETDAARGTTAAARARRTPSTGRPPAEKEDP